MRPRSVTLAAFIVLFGAAWLLIQGLLNLTNIVPIEGVSPLAAGTPRVVFALVWGCLGFFMLRQEDWVGLFALGSVLMGVIGAIASFTGGGGTGTGLVGTLALLGLLALLLLLFTPTVRKALNPQQKRPWGVSLVGLFYFLKFFAMVSLVMMTVSSLLAGEEPARVLEPPVAWVLLPLGLVLMAVTFAGGMGLAGLRSWGWKYVVGLHWFALAVSVLLLAIAGSMGRLDSGSLGESTAGFLYLGIVLGYLYRSKVRRAFEVGGSEVGTV